LISNHFRRCDTLLLTSLPYPIREVEVELEHDEDVGAWVEVIRGWMERQKVDEVKLLELLNGIGLSVVKVWLDLLLGGCNLKQNAGFYDGSGLAITL
jgi:hypothetical protein